MRLRDLIIDLPVYLLSVAHDLTWYCNVSHGRNSMLFSLCAPLIFLIPALFCSVFSLPANMPFLTLTVGRKLRVVSVSVSFYLAWRPFLWPLRYCLNCTNYYAAFLKLCIPEEEGSFLSAAWKESQRPWKADFALFLIASIEEEFKE